MAWSTDTPRVIPPEVEANLKLKDALTRKDSIEAKDIKSVLWALWDSSNTLSQIDQPNQETIKRSALTILAKPANDRSLGDRFILELYEKLFPLEAALQKQLVPTNQPSANIQSLRNPDGKINMAELQKLWDLSPESIKEKFKTLNKWDLKLIMQAIDALPNDVKTKLKEAMGTVLDSMIVNGFSIEDIKDLEFLKQNWSPALKEYFQTKLKASEVATITADIQNGKKYVLKNTNNTYTINALTSETGTLPAWLDLSKLNTLDTKTAVADIQKRAEQMKQAGQGWDMDSIRTMIKWLKKFGSLGEFLALIFGGIFGVNDSGDKKEWWPEKAKTNLEKRKMLDKMSVKNDKYDLSSLFDAKTGKITGEQTSKEFQEYLKDVYVLVGKELPKKEDEKLTYDTSLIELVKKYENSLGIEAKDQTWRLDKAKVDLILSKLDPNGELKKTEWAVPTTPEVVEADHPQKELFEKMKWKTTRDIRADKWIQKEIRDKIWDRNAIIRLQEEVWLQRNGVWNQKADGIIWEVTVDKFFRTFENWKIKSPKPAPAAPKQ